MPVIPGLILLVSLVLGGSPAGGALDGTVLETMDSGSYTYLRLETAAGEVWAAVSQAPVTRGAAVSVLNATLIEGFESRTLGRKFDRIYLGVLAGANPHAGMGGSMDAATAAHAAASAQPADAGEVKVARAEGTDGRTVAEVFAQRTVLADKAVTVRGKVVKFLPGIMGRNWVHLRDGSGSAETRDSDLTVTTADTVAVGDVVLMKGTVRKDRDFGAGYAYPLILEEAKLTK